MNTLSGIFSSPGGYGPLVDVITGTEQDRAAELNARIAALNETKRTLKEFDLNIEQSLGQITPAQREFGITQADALLAHQNAALGDPSTYRGQVADAAVEGAQEGLAWEQRSVERVTNAVVGNVFAFIPTWAWIAGGVYGLYYLGVFDDLKGSLKGAAAKKLRKYNN